MVVFTNDPDPCGNDTAELDRIRQHANGLKELGSDLQVFPLTNDEGLGRGRTFDGRFWQKVLSAVAGASGAPGASGGPPEEDGRGFVDRMGLNMANTFRQVRRKINRKRRVFATDVRISDAFRIPVEYYIPYNGQTKPTPKNLDARSNALLTSDTTHIVEATGAEAEHPLKGWTVGGRTIVASYEEFADIHTIVPTGFHLLGFRSVETIKCYHQMRPAAFLYANEHEHGGSMRRFLAFHHQMMMRDVCMVCSFTSGRSHTCDLVALVAQGELKDAYENQLEPPGLRVVFLPYADDMRHPERAQGATSRGVHVASDEQTEKAARVVRSLRMDDFDCTAIHNPLMQRYFDVLQALALKEPLTDGAKGGGGGGNTFGKDEARFAAAKADIDALRGALPPMNSRKRGRT